MGPPPTRTWPSNNNIKHINNIKSQIVEAKLDSFNRSIKNNYASAPLIFGSTVRGYAVWCQKVTYNVLVKSKQTLLS
jgi:hypothetical protein